MHLLSFSSSWRWLQAWLLPQLSDEPPPQPAGQKMCTAQSDFIFLGESEQRYSGSNKWKTWSFKDLGVQLTTIYTKEYARALSVLTASHCSVAVLSAYFGANSTQQQKQCHPNVRAGSHAVSIHSVKRGSSCALPTSFHFCQQRLSKTVSRTSGSLILDFEQVMLPHLENALPLPFYLKASRLPRSFQGLTPQSPPKVQNFGVSLSCFQSFSSPWGALPQPSWRLPGLPQA